MDFVNVYFGWFKRFGALTLYIASNEVPVAFSG